MAENELKNLEEEFLVSNRELIESIEQDSVKSYLQSMDEFYKENINIFQYAEVQLGLAHFLDFHLNNDQFNQLCLQINSVSSLAWQIVQIYQNSCGQHEDGACVVGGIAFTRVSLPLNHTIQTTQWPDLPMAHALSFVSPVQPITIPIGIKLHRIIGQGGNSRGHWWLEDKPTSKCQWRSDAAVLSAWNAGDQYVMLTVKKELPVWRGKTATQVVYPSNTNCYLKGGGIQIWLEPDAGSVDISSPMSW